MQKVQNWTFIYNYAFTWLKATFKALKRIPITLHQLQENMYLECKKVQNTTFMYNCAFNCMNFVFKCENLPCGISKNLYVIVIIKYNPLLQCDSAKEILAESFYIVNYGSSITYYVKTFVKKIKTNICDDITKIIHYGISIQVLSWRQQKQKCLFWLLRFFDEFFDIIIDDP